MGQRGRWDEGMKGQWDSLFFNDSCVFPRQWAHFKLNSKQDTLNLIIKRFFEHVISFVDEKSFSVSLILVRVIICFCFVNYYMTFQNFKGYYLQYVICPAFEINIDKVIQYFNLAYKSIYSCMIILFLWGENEKRRRKKTVKKRKNKKKGKRRKE